MQCLNQFLPRLIDGIRTNLVATIERKKELLKEKHSVLAHFIEAIRREEGLVVSATDGEETYG